MAAPLLLVAGGLQVWSGLQQAELIKQQSKLNQRIAEENAKYAEIDAWEAEKYGYTQSARYKSIVDATVADQRVAFAAQNVDVSSGTAAAIQDDTQLVGFLNSLDIQNAARQKALGLKLQASNIRLGSDFAKSEAETRAFGAKMSGLFNSTKYFTEGFQGSSSKPQPESSTGYSSTGYGSAGQSYNTQEGIV